MGKVGHMKTSNKTIIKCLILILAVLLLVGGAIKFLHSAFIEKFRLEGIRGKGIVLSLYASDYGTLPPLDKWCDVLIEEADCGTGHFMGYVDREEGKCGYAVNENLDGLKFSELDGKIVLAFEAKGEWNLSGGAELAKKYKQKKIYVVFVDESVKFVKIEDIDKLKWKP